MARTDAISLRKHIAGASRGLLPAILVPSLLRHRRVL
jgi:hypothetical protein